MSEKLSKSALTGAELKDVYILSRLLVRVADEEPGLLDHPETCKARVRGFVDADWLASREGRWPDIEAAALEDAHYFCSIWGRAFSVIFFCLLIGCAAAGEAFYHTGPLAVLGGLSLLYFLVPWLSATIVGFSAWAARRHIESRKPREGLFKRVKLWFAKGWLRRVLRKLFIPSGKAADRTPFFAWVFRYTAIRPISPSFLVAAIGLIGAAIATAHAVEVAGVHEQLLRLPEGDREVAFMRRWLWEARGELALTALLGMSAYLIENVLGDLALTRKGLSGVAVQLGESVEQAKSINAHTDSATEMLAGLKESITKSTEEWEAALKVRAFERLTSTMHDLESDASRLAAAEERTADETGIMVAKNAVARRLQSFTKVIANLVDVVQRIITVKAKGDEPRQAMEELYQLNLVATAFEAALESQTGLFRSADENGRHFQIVAPFEALGGVVSKFVDAIRSRPSGMTPDETGRKVRFYTVLPIRPKNFFDGVAWDGDPKAGGKLDGSRAEAWCAFLNSSREAAKGVPEIIRHFISIERELVGEILKETRTDVDAQYDHYVVPTNAEPQEPSFWNPLALERDKFLLWKDRIDTDFTGSYVKASAVRDLETAVEPVKEESTAAGAQTKETWRIVVRNAREAGLERLDRVLAEYHPADCSDGQGSGLRKMTFGPSDWTNRKPAPQSALDLILARHGNGWSWVDYFAAYLECTGDENAGQHKGWIFAIRSDFDAEQGVVHMHLRFPGQSDWDTKTVPELNRLFGLDGASRDHIKSYRPDGAFK